MTESTSEAHFRPSLQTLIADVDIVSFVGLFCKRDLELEEAYYKFKVSFAKGPYKRAKS